MMKMFVYKCVCVYLGLYGRLQDIQPIPQSLQPLLLQALDDPDRRVQIAAAVCQYAMGNANAHAQEILHNTIHQGTPAGPHFKFHVGEVESLASL